MLDKLAQIEKMQQEMQEMKTKTQWADDWEKRISKLADEGKLKFQEDGEVDIVADVDEQQYLQESRKKEKVE